MPPLWRAHEMKEDLLQGGALHLQVVWLDALLQQGCCHMLEDRAFAFNKSEQRFPVLQHWG